MFSFLGLLIDTPMVQHFLHIVILLNLIFLKILIYFKFLLFICVVVRRQLLVLSSDLGFWGIRHEARTEYACAHCGSSLALNNFCFLILTFLLPLGSFGEPMAQQYSQWYFLMDESTECCTWFGPI